MESRLIMTLCCCPMTFLGLATLIKRNTFLFIRFSCSFYLSELIYVFDPADADFYYIGSWNYFYSYEIFFWRTNEWVEKKKTFESDEKKLPIAYLWNFCTSDLLHVSKLCGCIFSPLYKRILNVKYFDTIRLVGGRGGGSKCSWIASRWRYSRKHNFDRYYNLNNLKCVLYRQIS